MAAAVLALCATPATAAAWLADNEGQSIQTAAFGRQADGPFMESQLYIERGFGDRFSVVARPWVQTGPNAGPLGWRAEGELGAKLRVGPRYGPLAAAVQASALYRTDPGLACGPGGLALRALAGRSLGRGFANIEAGVRMDEGGCQSQSLDLAVGYRPNNDWLGLAETFVRADGQPNMGVTAQLSLVRFAADGRGLQLGIRTRVDGGDPEPTLVLGLWGRARD